MSPAVAAAVLGSALLHAIWNALAKAIPHRLLASALIGATYLVLGAAWCAIAPLPDAASWPFLAVSALLQTGYLLLLTAAYSRGEFRKVYPLARGTAPLLVTVVSVVVLGERPHLAQLAGIALVAAALGVLVLPPRPREAHGPADPARTGPPPPSETRAADGNHSARRPGHSTGLVLAAATGVLIAAYSLVDGLGVRHSGSAAGYAAWLMAVQGPLLVLTCLALAGPRQLAGWLRTGDPLLGLPSRRGPEPSRGDRGRRGRPGLMLTAGIAGGVLSLAAYAIVLWAQDRASLSLVSATRETSVLFAGVIGAALFAEGFSARQTVAACGVVAGIVLMQLG